MADLGYLSVLQGSLDNLPTLNSRLVRIFISSTFTDTKEERNVLLEDVYPQLKELCKEKYGMEFQIVDMRWGVPQEASDDHMATTLCIDEIRNCQKLSTGPNFVWRNKLNARKAASIRERVNVWIFSGRKTFLNQKHGYRPLQLFIQDTEFCNLRNCLTENGSDTGLMEKWYLKDENQEPAIRVLQPISSIIPGIKDKDSTKAQEEWDQTFQTIRSDMRLGSKLCHDQQLLTEEEKHKYYMSVTEYEIITGVLDLQNDATDQCLCFVRIIEDIRSHLDHNKAYRFIDLMSRETKTVDEESQSILSQLRDKKLAKKLNDFNIARHIVKWSDREGINREDHSDYLTQFKEAFYNRIMAMIDEAVKKDTSLIKDELFIEVLQHASMANQRCEMFHGREEILASIEMYLSKHQLEPLVLYGQSGCGKTSIMAQAAKMVSSLSPKAVAVLRFLGTSPHSSNLWHLLKSLCQQIVLCYNVQKQVPDDVDQLKEFFLHALKFASADKPLVILLDSLDQLSHEHHAHKLNWLPRKLPPHVRLIVSTYTEALNLIGILRVVFLASSFVMVPVFSTELSILVLKSWLGKKRRRLTSDQFSLVSKAFDRCSLPLFVKLTYDQVLTWRSYMPLSKCILTSTVQESIEMLFSQLEKKHGGVLVSRALAYVTASKSGISEMELEDLLSLDDVVLTNVFQIHVPPLRRIPPLLWVRIRHDISQYLVDKEVDEVRSFFWYHRQFYETATKRFLSDKETQQDIHSMMADYYTGKWYGVKKPFQYTPQQMARVGAKSIEDEADRKISAQPMIFHHDKDNTNIRYNKRKLSKLPYHLFKANRIKELRANCLFKYEWIQTKLAANMLQALLLDYTMSSEENSVIYKTLKACKSTIKKFPDTLSMEISGRLLTLFQSNPDAHEMKLLEDSIKASKRQSKLVPFQSCYSVPSEAHLYTVEHSRVPVNTKMAAISNDSLHLAILSNENEVLLFDLVSGEMETSLALEVENETNFNVMMKPQGRDVVIVGKTSQMRANPVVMVSINNCLVENKLLLKKLYNSIGFTDDLQFRLAGKKLLVNVLRQAADVFDSDTGELLHEFEGNPDQVELTADETLLILHPKQTNFFTVHDMKTIKHLYQITCDETPLSLCLGKDSEFGCIVMNNHPIISLVCVDSSGANINKTTRIDLSKTGHTKVQTAQIYNQLCLITTMEGFILWDVKSNRKKSEFLIPQALKPSYRVLEFAGIISPDGSTLVCGYDRFLVLWDIKTDKLLNSTEATSSDIVNMMMSPCGQYIVHMCGRNSSVMTWKLSALKKGFKEYQPFSMKDSARFIAVDRIGETAVIRSHSATDFAVVDLDSGAKRCAISQTYEAMQPQITSDGKYAVLREYHSYRCVKVWDLDTGNLVTSLNYSSLNFKGYTLGTRVENMAFILETIEGNCVFGFCDIPSGKTLHEVELPKCSIRQVVFVKDDKYCLIGMEEQLHPVARTYAKCLEVKTGKLIQEFERMNPKMIQMITPESDCFMGHQICTDKTGKESWELVVLKIETGEVKVRCDKVPSNILFIGHVGRYGIDNQRTVFDIQKGERCFQFDSDEDYEIIPNRRSAPRLTSDEKFAVMVQLNHKLMKVGDVGTGSIVSVVPIHSEAMAIEITPKNVVLIGCEDGRVMMLQIVGEREDSSLLLQTIFRRSKKKIASTKESAMKTFGSKTEKSTQRKVEKRNVQSPQTKESVLNTLRSITEMKARLRKNERKNVQNTKKQPPKGQSIMCSIA